MKMRVAEIGDNCIDVYERIGQKYPILFRGCSRWHPAAHTAQTT